MATVLPHFFAGLAMFIIGRSFYKEYFEEKDNFKEHLFLLFVCLSFSFLPDIILIAHYTTKVSSYATLSPYHTIIHIIIVPTSIMLLIILKYKIEVKREPIWIMGLWSLILHVIMDFLIPEQGLWY
jgi:membrane-bound metal-dependent hydrolase YbcI (DUF457 family)